LPELCPTKEHCHFTGAKGHVFVYGWNRDEYLSVCGLVINDVLDATHPIGIGAAMGILRQMRKARQAELAEENPDIP